jgi:signal transduction histidine kinase
MARAALESANRTMATLARILDQDLSAELGALDALIEREREGRDDPETVALLREIGDLVNAIARRVAVAREFNELGARPPAWQPLGGAVVQARARLDPGAVAVRAWVDRLEVYADPALPSALYHLLHNATRPAIGATAVVVSFHHAPDGCRVYIEDDGAGFPPSERAALDPQGGVQDRRGLSFVRETLGITGIRVTEEGTGRGARFVLTVPQEACRVQ